MRLLLTKIATWLLAVVVVGILVAVFSEWFIEVARDKGLFQNAGDRWDYAMGIISDWATSGWILYPVTALAGYVAGLWTDTFIKRKEEPPRDGPLRMDERIALAIRAEDLASKIATITGEFKGRILRAQSEINVEDAQRLPTESAFLARMRYNEDDLQAKLIERYMERYHTDVCQVVAQARKLIEIDRISYYRFDRNMNPHSIDSLPAFLTEIATNLRDPRPTIPLTIHSD